MLIARAAVEEFLSRKLDDFRWMKELKREQLLRELSALRIRPKFKTEPWLHQLVCFYVAMAHPRFMWLLDMGSGKSKIILDILYQKLREGKIDRGLIVVPRIINISSWMDDFAKHSELEPWPIDVTDIEEKRHRLLKPKGDATIIDTASLMLALCPKVKDTRKKRKGKSRMDWDEHLVKELLRTYNFLDLDEVHKFQSHDSLWFRTVNQISKGMDFCYGNTGTLFGKDVQAMWSPYYLVDRGETLGETMGPFRAALFDTKMNPWKGETYTFRKDMEEELNRILQHRSIRYEEGELQELPKAVPLTRQMEMEPDQKTHYLRAMEGLINAGGNLRELDAQYVRMRQIISGYLAWEDDYGKHIQPFKKNPKLDELESLIDECGDSKRVVVYWYTETGRMIVDRIKEMGLRVEWLYGGTKDHAALRRRFMDPKGPEVLVMQAEAGGTGLDGLQEVARYMFFYETPSDPRLRLQTERRIRRQGQTKRCFYYDLVMRQSMDKGLLEDLKEGIDSHRAIVDGKRRSRGFLLGY